MKTPILSVQLALWLLLPFTFAAAQTDPGKIEGRVVSSGKPVPFANVGVLNTTLGAITDINGRFLIDQVPEGTHPVRVSFVGYRTWEGKVTVSAAKPLAFLEIQLHEERSLLEEVVVTGTRTEKRRIDSAVPVNILDSRAITATQSLNLSEGLAYQPGIRVERDCQTCNYTQVRMNGLPGPYSQILINSRPLLSALAGLYGLEQIPASMIERVEVIKGGGSVLYGSNAVAGTINIITRKPSGNTAEVSTNGSWISENASDYQSSAIVSLSDKKQYNGGTIIVSHRDRASWDANDDGFSELAAIENISFSGSGNIRTGKSSTLNFGLHSINEIRNGGDKLHLKPHERLQTEYRDSKILAGNLDFRKEFYGKRTVLDLYAGGQQTKRDHYTGAYGSDGYGNTDSKTLQGGVQINHTLLNFLSSKNTITLGADYQADDVFDEIKAYSYLIDQQTFQTGIFVQSDWEVTGKINLLTGLRYTTHNKTDDPVWSPAISVLYKALPGLQIRASRSTGFRAPQVFDTDMHIAFSGGGISLTEVDPALNPEHSVSYAASVDYNKAGKNYIYGLTLGGFQTRISDTFILEEKAGNSGDNTILFRTNGGASGVYGLTLEARANYNYKIEGDMGFTFQKSLYDEAVSWSQEVEGSKKMLRTPEAYGYMNVTWTVISPVRLSLSGVYTGEMLVPHFAGAPGVENDRLKRSPDFMEINLKAEYRVSPGRKRTEWRVYAGIQNIFNEFQSDFDRGPNRDSNYMYGPGRPRTVFAGLAWRWGT